MHRQSIKGGVAAVALLLAGCATSSAPPPPRVAGPAHIDLGLATQAAPFEAFTRTAAAIDPGFRSAGDVAEGLRAGAGYDPRQLEAGMIAYAAMAALQEPAFAIAARRPEARAVARQLAANPDAVFALPGAQAAAGRANAALARRGEALADAGGKVRKSAYAVQRQGAWAKAKVPNGPARLALAKRLAGYRPAESDRAYLMSAVAQAGRRGGPNPISTRAVAYAALTALGEERQGSALLEERTSASCLRLAKLNFHQCLASAGTHYEDIYCLGVHAMNEPGQCVVDAVSGGPKRTALR